MGAVPQSTVRTTGAGITTYVGQYVNATIGYWVGADQVITAGLDASFDELTLTGDLLNTYNVTQALQYPQQAASYIVWVDSGTYYAKNGDTGVIDYSSTNATVIFNAIFVPNAGLIQIKTGTYYIDRNITIQDRTTVIGEGKSSTYIRRNTANVTVILKTSVGWAQGITLQDLTIHGDSKDGDVLQIVTGASVSLNRVSITQSTGNGLHVLSGAWGVSAFDVDCTLCNIGAVIKANFFEATNSRFSDNVETNLRVTSDGVTLRAIGCIIEQVSGVNAWNMEIIGGTKETWSNHLVSGCTFEDAPAGGGNIHIFNKTTSDMRGIIITNNFFTEDGTSIKIEDALNAIIETNFFYGAGTGVDLQASAVNCSISNNIFANTSPYSDSGSGTKIIGNYGSGTDLYDMDQSVKTTDAVSFTTVDTGYGANELYGMNQNVTTTSSPQFNGVDVDWVDLGGVNRTTWPSAGAISGNVTLGDGEYYCYIEGSNYVAINRTKVLYNNTDPDTCIQTALDAATSNSAGIVTYLTGRVHDYALVKVGPGVWNFGATVVTIGNQIKLQGSMQTVFLSSATACLQGEWSNYTWGVVIEDLIIWGPGLGGGEIGIDWDMDNCDLAPGVPGTQYTPMGEMLTVNKVVIREFTYPLYLVSTAGENPTVRITNLRANGALYLSRIFDSWFTDIGVGRIEFNIGCTNNIFSNGYVGGGTQYNLQVHGDSDQFSNKGNQFSNFRFDNPLQTWVLLDDHAEANLFTGCVFSNIYTGALNGVYSGIILSNDTHHNTFTGNNFVNNRNNAVNLKWVIEEQTGSENNTYVGNTYQDDDYFDDWLWNRTVGRLFKTWNPTVSNFENRKQTMTGGVAVVYGDVSTRYMAPTNLYSSSTGSTDRAVKWWGNGSIANLRVSQLAGPGVGDFRGYAIYYADATEYLNVTLTGANSYGSNTGFIEIVTDIDGEYLTIITKCNAGAATAERGFYQWDWYPRAEDVLNLPYN